VIQRRWAIHIIREILNYIDGVQSPSKSQIRTMAAMNLNQTEAYLDFLLVREFIRESPAHSVTNGSNGTHYEITQEGRELTRRIDDLILFMGLEDAEEPPAAQPLGAASHKPFPTRELVNGLRGGK
jgi:predicted transcriptional regulator